MQSTAVKLKYDTLRSLAFGSVAAGYTAVGTVLLNPVKIFKVTNLTDAAILVSLDGTTDHDVCPPSGAYILDCAANQAANGGDLQIAAGQIVYVKRVSGAPTLGSVYVTVLYASV